MTKTTELPKRISLMVSDVDGTLVTRDKLLAPATIAAVQKLRDAGIQFAIVSSRPPRGMAQLIEPLKLELIGGFNGAAIVRPDMSSVEQHFVPEAAAKISVEVMTRYGADVWVFGDNQWFVTNGEEDYVPRERRTVQFDPIVVPNFDGHLSQVGKIVGSSKDFDMLARCEAELQGILGTTASARRSQSYYLDVTHPMADKGYAVKAFAKHWNVPLEEVAVIGDMANDLPMFEVGHLAIAMGNAPDAVKALANVVTTSNEEDGVARAIEEFILPRAR
jgi:Cof subfamily protein (haloacid dehalogenase superfamily)